MKLIQLNVWQGFVAKKTIELIAHEKPDILTAQEVLSCPTASAHFSNLTIHEQLCELFEYHYFEPTHEYNLGESAAQFGNVIYSNHPIVQTEHLFTHGNKLTTKPDVDSDYNVRNIIRADIQIDSHILSVYTHHGYHTNLSSGDEHTVASHTAAAKFVTAEFPTILTGDLNTEPQSPAMKPFYDLELDEISTTQLGTNTTLGKLSHVSVPVICDYIFATGIHTDKLRCVDELASDHKALILEFSL